MPAEAPIRLRFVVQAGGSKAKPAGPYYALSMSS